MISAALDAKSGSPLAYNAPAGAATDRPRPGPMYGVFAPCEPQPACGGSSPRFVVSGSVDLGAVAGCELIGADQFPGGRHDYHQRQRRVCLS